MNARVFALRASAAALLLASASLVSSPPALSAPWTSGGSPDVNPCIELKRHLFPPGQRNFVLVTYDGIERLRALPSPPIPYPAALRGKSPACLAFRVDLVSGSGGVEVRQPELLRVHLVNSQDLQPSYGDFRAAALALLPRMITGGFLPREPKVNEYQVVFVPLWPQHPMFGSDPSQAWSADLADLGFADARRIGGPGDVALFVLGEGRNPDLLDLVAIRSFAADEPIVDLSSEGSAPYGPATMRWLERDVFPRLAPTLGLRATIQIRLYDRDTIYPPADPEDIFPQLVFPPVSRDPVTNASVARPLGVLSLWAVRNAPGAPLQWSRATTTQAFQFNTLAEIRTVHAQYEERRNHMLAAARRANADEPARYAAAKQAYQDETRRDAAAAAARGLVYRSPAYWASYANDIYFAGILDGTFNRNMDLLLAEIYVRYQAWFSGACPEWLPPGSPGIRYDTIVRSGFNDPGTTFRGEDIPIRPRYWDRFAAFLETRAQGINANISSGTRDTALMSAQLSTMAEIAGGITADLRRLFEDNGCDSGLARQFDDNLYRIAHGLPALQDEPRNHGYAARDDTAGRVRPNLASACVEHDLFARPGRHAGERADARRFCRCIDDRFTTVLSPAERQAAIEDYPSFAQKIYEVPTGGSRDPQWRYYQNANPCRR